jgi:hypothetical protein
VRKWNGQLQWDEVMCSGYGLQCFVRCNAQPKEVLGFAGHKEARQESGAFVGIDIQQQLLCEEMWG